MRRIHPILLLLVVTAALAGGLCNTAGAPNRLFSSDPPPVIRSWGTTAGLPQNSVNAIAQSRDGYLWLGTSDGLVRFDGVRFTAFGLEAGLPSVDVRALMEDREGVLWIATAGGGFGRWRDGRVEQVGPEVESDIVSCLAEDAAGRLWVGTREGLHCFENGRPVPTPGLELIGNTPIRSLLFDATGTLWIATPTPGLVAYRDGQATVCPGPPAATAWRTCAPG